MSALPLALYVHMPWCVRKCPYCDFNSHQLKSGAPDRTYIDALIRDFEHELPLIRTRRIETIFFGGGTPSLFDAQEIGRLLCALRARIEFAADAEITLEANPGTIERGRFEGYAAAGINRVSLGAQTFDADALKVLGRIHGPEDTLRAVEELKSSGITNFNLDLMFALPGQSLSQAESDVRSAVHLGPTHISYYQLTLEPGTVFYTRPPRLPDEDSAWEMQQAGQSLLAAGGYLQYEVSAYARDGARCRHNLNYWLFGDYVGIGAGAHGKLTQQLPGRILRTVKPKQPRDYSAALQGPVEGAAPGERQLVATAELPFEFMLNALRVNDGFDASLFAQRTGLPIEFIRQPLEEVRQRGLLESRPGGWQPTALGRRFLNDLTAHFLA